MDRSEINELKTVYPSARDHQSRVAPGWWVTVCIGAVLIIVGACLYFADGVNALGKQVAVWMGGIGVAVACSAPMLPRSVVVFLGGLFTEQSAPDTVLASERQHQSSNLLLEAGILIAVLLPVHFAMFLLFDLNMKVVGISILVPVGCWSFSIMYRQKLRPSKNLIHELEPELESWDYHTRDEKPFKDFLRHSFLKLGLSFDVTEVWAKHCGGGMIVWGRYVSSDVVDSGVFCAYEPYRRMAGSHVGQLMATRGSVYVDEVSSSLFGTLRFGAATSLNGVPWQHYGASIICRFDVETIVSLKRGATDTGHELNAGKLIHDWELIILDLAAEAAETTPRKPAGPDRFREHQP
ncbi:hypothetical protein [Stieleria mannarensis]|uniref:hypothetical protein n=1 Tax=Stieleria mannarensis TaxID=2755585 RepID=UPI001600891C|nr:hypothetical protein [Rhodopirellula sp. JC639]